MSDEPHNSAKVSLAVPLDPLISLAGLVGLVASFMPWYTFEEFSQTGESFGEVIFSGWHGALSVIGTLLVALGGTMAAFAFFGGRAPAHRALSFAVVASFGAATIAIVLALFVRPSDDFSYLPVGHGPGHWIGLFGSATGFGVALTERLLLRQRARPPRSQASS